MKIDRYGDRSNIELDILRINAGGQSLYGTWTPSSGLLTASGDQSRPSQGILDLSKPLVITTVLVCMINDLSINLTNHSSGL